MNQDDWGNGIEVEAPLPPMKPKQCETVNCLLQFTPTWPKQRRCPKCRKEGRTTYKSPDSPF